MKTTRQQRARFMLERMGINGADGFTEKSLGAKPERNRQIVAAVIFDGWTLKRAGEKYGISAEQARIVSLGSVRRLVGRYEDEPTQTVPSQ